MENRDNFDEFMTEEEFADMLDVSLTQNDFLPENFEFLTEDDTFFLLFTNMTDSSTSGIPDPDSSFEMAEALMEESLPSTDTKFFCHKCSVEIPRVLPDFTCPTCYSGFIEEIEPLQEDENEPDSGDESLGPSGHDFVSLMMGELAGDPQHRHTEDGGTRFTMRSQRHMQQLPLENLIQDFIVNITGMDWAQLGAAEGGRRVTPVSFFLGNPGDYAWGREGLDAIVTQLLNQMDGTGPPPLAKDKIQGIPTVQIAKEQVDQSLQCSVCWEDFTLGENVRKLPCEHFYHENCIIPWLELHGTCPICRKVLHEEGSDDPSRGTSAPSTANSLPQSLAALFRAASGAGVRDSSQASQDSSSSGGSSNALGSSSSTTSTSSSTRPNTRSQRNQPPRDNQFWDMDLEFD